MRELIIGIILGIWITVLLALVERYKMSDYLIWVFIGVTVILLFVASWRLILKVIAHYNPELWLKINQINSPVIYDEKMQERLAERKKQREKRKGGIKENEL